MYCFWLKSFLSRRLKYYHYCRVRINRIVFHRLIFWYWLWLKFNQWLIKYLSWILWVKIELYFSLFNHYFNIFFYQVVSYKNPFIIYYLKLFILHFQESLKFNIFNSSFELFLFMIIGKYAWIKLFPKFFYRVFLNFNTIENRLFFFIKFLLSSSVRHYHIHSFQNFHLYFVTVPRI